MPAYNSRSYLSLREVRAETQARMEAENTEANCLVAHSVAWLVSFLLQSRTTCLGMLLP